MRSAVTFRSAVPTWPSFTSRVCFLMIIVERRSSAPVKVVVSNIKVLRPVSLEVKDGPFRKATPTAVGGISKLHQYPIVPHLAYAWRGKASRGTRVRTYAHAAEFVQPANYSLQSPVESFPKRRRRSRSSSAARPSRFRGPRG